MSSAGKARGRKELGAGGTAAGSSLVRIHGRFPSCSDSGSLSQRTTQQTFLKQVGVRAGLVRELGGVEDCCREAGHASYRQMFASVTCLGRC